MSFDTDGSDFTRTRWTLIRQIQSGTAEQQERARQELAAIYLGPLYHFYRRAGHQPADAEDLTCGFVMERLLNGPLLDRADARAGQMRSLIRTAARNYRRDADRARAARSRAETEYAERCRAEEPYYVEGTSPAETVLNQQLAIQLLERAIEIVAARLRASNREVVWRAFELRHLEPLRGNVTPPTAIATARQLGLDEPNRVSGAVAECKAKVARAYIEAMRSTIGESDDFDAEFEALLSALTQAINSHDD